MRKSRDLSPAGCARQSEWSEVTRFSWEVDDPIVLHSFTDKLF